jgi:hypothetical protein
MQLTDHRIFFTWEDRRRREDIPIFEDAEKALKLPPPPMEVPSLDREFGIPLWIGKHGGYSIMTSVPLGADCVRFVEVPGGIECNSVGCIDFSLMPESYASEI